MNIDDLIEKLQKMRKDCGNIPMGFFYNDELIDWDTARFVGDDEVAIMVFEKTKK